MTSPIPHADQAPGRRAILRGAALLGLGGALAACGGGGSDPAAAAQPAAPAAPAKPAKLATAGGGTVLGATSEVPVGGGKIYKDELVVVTQPTKGNFKAFSATCTHTGCPVAEVSEGTINCFCHGSMYSISDGSVVKPPAPKPLPVKNIKVAGGKITLI